MPYFDNVVMTVDINNALYLELETDLKKRLKLQSKVGKWLVSKNT